VGNINLDDVKGFFRELVWPNYVDFQQEFQLDVECDTQRKILIFRKLVNLCLALNHQADKVAKKLNYGNALSLLAEISAHYPAEASSIDAVRKFTNDIKHEARLGSSFHSRPRVATDNPNIGNELPEWYFLDEHNNKIEISDNATKACLFWGKWLAGERNNLVKKT